jgi:hypothetical protein
VKDLPGRGIAISYYDLDGMELFVRKRDVPRGPRFKQPAGVQLRPCGLNRLDVARLRGHLYLTEGESGAWTLWACELPALGLPGSGAAKALKAEHLGDVHDLYVLPDNDPAGEKFLAGVLDRLRGLNFHGRVWRVHVPKGQKDVSEWWCANPRAFPHGLKEAVKNAERLALPAARAKDSPPAADTSRLATTCLAESKGVTAHPPDIIGSAR